jgi:hypothetical protein
MFAQEHEQPKGTQQRNINVQVDREILLNSSRNAGKAKEE